MRFEEIAAPAEGPGSRRAVRRAASRLRRGGIVVHPTATVYGLGARVTRDLDEELARLKSRPPGKPFVRLAPDLEAARSAAARDGWDDRAERLAREFWPGALTLVLDDGSPDGLAVRVDSHPVVLALLAELRELMSSTSVNRGGDRPAWDPPDVRAELERMPGTERPVLLLDAGPAARKVPSTLLSLRERGPPRLLRAGAVDVQEIEACLEETVVR